MKELQTVLNNILADKNTNLKPENLKKGVTCLGVTGTLEASTSSGGVKQFSTVEEMNASTGNTEGDLAIVYRNILANMTADTETQYITFPDTVTLPTAFTGEYYGRIRAVDSSAMFDGQVMLNQTSFEFSGYSETGETMINYTSTDGITYTRSTTITNPVDLGTAVKSYHEWNDNLGYFMKIGSSSFTGLYKYSGTAWELAPTGLTTAADEVYLTKFYGKNGVTTGTLTTNVSNSFADTNAAVYKKVQQAYNNMTPRVLTDTDKTIDKSIYFIPTKPDGTVLLDTRAVTNMGSMFSNCNNLTTIPLLDTSAVTNMGGMFSNCNNLTTIPLLDTSKVTNMGSMFSGCTNLTEIPQLDTSNVTEMNQMFYGCNNLTEVPLLDTSKVTSFYQTFDNCSNLTAIPAFDTSNVTEMNYCFSMCTSLVTLPVLNTSKVKTMPGLVSGCSALSDDSLNNVLAMCANATSYTSTKTLKYVGLTSEQATKCTTLSNYEAFTAAGWMTGY